MYTPSEYYPTLKALQRGEIIDLEGIRLKMDDGEIKPGDLYVAERNTGPKLLTAGDIKYSCIFPTTIDYPYDIWECVKVHEA